MTSERRCEVETPVSKLRGVVPCGALIVEGRCRTPMHHPRDRAMHDQYDYGHAYDGWECEQGHSVAAEVVA